MSIPASATVAPERVRMLAGEAELVCVWRNELGGLTFRATSPGAQARFIKWGPRNAETSMRDEAERMRWARRWTTVPRVIDQGEDAVHEWLVTAAIEADSAVAPQWVARPEVAVPAIGRALRRLHDALPADSCPWSWNVRDRLENAARRGIVVPEHLRDAPPIDVAVVCHGDACCPNTLIAADGTGIAHVDLAALGVADRWADIAVASMSTEWNYGPGWEDTLIDAYGVAPDRERLAYYRDLWNAT
ncbi:aminoglycoside 3'-phosphotransferase [Microbacterium sp.]|uniref:aminoglycoside 3'-phosphotransferase n=1 Tax=Microbacterium sp. TaxID=51671 RepID=UPI0028118DFE|nr:aminoglycoside 3'-phosphotransferase [Microbacterium sp.]